MDDVKVPDIQALLEYFSKNTYKAKETDSTGHEIMNRCLTLVNVDYSHVVIGNTCGELSGSYPSQLIILEYERNHGSVNGSFIRPSVDPPRTTGTIYESMHDVGKLKDLFSKARFARCRARFPLPVILYRGKHICRSATLSGGPEIYGRSGLDYFFSGSEYPPEDGDFEEMGVDAAHPAPPPPGGDWQLFDRVRSQDIRLLKTLNVGTIVDFMVEKKKVKFGMNVTSSEKVDKENRYSDFTIISLPYPGCEFFREFRDNDYTAEGLVFDWSQAHVDAHIGVPDDPVSTHLRIDWDDYKGWDLVRLTQNYMRLLLRHLQENSTGLLIHCISGWDRTPLFVSLLRLSLWADGAAHQSLTAAQILYLTIAYDWMLFGHNLVDRHSKGEEIFFFCFYFLKHLAEDEYSVSSRVKPRHSVLRNDSDLHLDGVLLDGETVSSRGSNISLNSSCSSVSSKSFDNPPVIFHNAADCFPLDGGEANGGLAVWPPTHRLEPGDNALSRTSPVAVPVPSRLRQRHESPGSLSAGSWQMISGTGSLRGTSSDGDVPSPRAQPLKPPAAATAGRSPLSNESSTTVIEDECFVYSTAAADPLALRRDRLKSVRTLFYNSYCSTIGFKFKSGPDSGLTSLFGNFAEKVGIISTQRTSV